MQLYNRNNERKKMKLSSDYRDDPNVTMTFKDGSVHTYPVSLIRELKREIKEKEKNGS